MRPVEEEAQLNLAHNWNFDRDFPQIDESVIDRPNFLETIVDILTSENPVVFLEGEEGDGATTTLAQFCLKYPDQTFSLFIKPASRFAYSLDYLRLALAEQFHWYVSGTSLDQPFIDSSQFESLVHQVRRKKKGKTFYFVVDGLHQIPSEDQRLIEQIVREVLPIGVDNFRFIIAGQQTVIGKYITNVGTKPYQQLKFRPDDTQKYLTDLRLSPFDVAEIHKICKAVPGRIASVKRLLASGTDLATILDSEPAKYLEFIRLEFNALDALSQSQQIVIAVLTFAKRALSPDELIEITGADENDLDVVQTTCRFLTKNSGIGVIEFVSESHRRFAERHLEKFQKKALSLQVEYLLRNPNSEVAIRFLPTYYQQLNQQQAIVDLLSTDHYAKLLETTQSLSALRNRAELGARSAATLKQATSIFKFALQRSIFIAVASQDALESEVSALVALDQSQKALTLANQAIAKEDRLSLLATYAKRVKEKRGTVDPELIQFIKELASQIEFAELGDKAVEIAADILFFDPDLAISIVEQANKRSLRPQELDAAFTHLSITASLSKIPKRIQVDDKARQRISDAALQKLAGSFATLVDTLSPDEVIRTVEQMAATHRIYFLKSYVSFRRGQEDILDVVEYALDLMIRETAYTPTSRDFAELAIPLAHATKDRDRLERLIERFENQVGLVAKASFSKDIVLLQMRLAHAELSFDVRRTSERIGQAYYDVASIKTPEVQSECYAIMLRMLRIIDWNDALEKSQGFRAVIKSDLTSLLDSILANTADHFAVVSGALRSLAADDGDAALDLASKLNVEIRRDEGYSAVVKVVAAQQFTEERNNIVQSGVGRICDAKTKSETIQQLIDVVEQNKDKEKWVGPISSLFAEIEIPEIACDYIIAEFRIRADTGQKPEIKEFEERFVNLIEKVDSKMAAINLYFKAVDALAKVDVDAANRYYDLGREIKRRINPNSPAARHIIELCISLISRTFGPLIRTGHFTDEMLFRFSGLVNMIPCSLTRMRIYSDLAARAWCAKRSDICKRVVQEKCVPLLDEAKQISVNLHHSLIQAVFPASRAAHAPSAFALLESLSIDEADDALYEGAMLILRKLPSNEPYLNDEFERFKLEREDALDLLEILERITSDSAFYWALEAMTQAICGKVNKFTFTAQQKADYARKIRQLIDKKLPDKRNIQHVGYKLAALAQTYRLEETPYKAWEALEQDAKSISNIADRGYVFLALAKCIPSRFDALRKRLLEGALELFHKIPSPIDRLSHYEGYANAASKDSAASAKEILRRAVLLSAEIEDTARVEKHRRQLIDIADRIDPALADELIELIDDDPARAFAKAELKRSLAIAKAKREIANAKAVKDVGNYNPKLLPDAAWKNVAALLAGRLETKPVDVMTEYVMSAGAHSLTEAYPILTWYLENIGRKYIGANEVADKISPICEALLLSTEMAATVMAQASRQKANLTVPGILDEISGGPVVRPKDRPHALKYIGEWLRANAVDYIKFSDPYFGPEDLSFLRMVLSECPECKVFILTSKQGLKKLGALTVEVFQEHWSRLVEQSPPETEIVAVGSDLDEKGLIHDRWILSKGCGLRIGTSFNSIGEGKLSEISEMEPAKAAVCEHHLNKFLDKQRLVDGKKVSYLTFTL